MTGDEGGTPLHHKASHWAGFAVSGALAFTTDVVVLALLNRGLGLDPFLARFIAIWCAMVVAWQSHRRLTFAVSHASTFKEFANYAAVAWVSSGVNYSLYSIILLVRRETDPLLALLAATVVSMVVSYAGMRFGVFTSRRRY